MTLKLYKRAFALTFIVKLIIALIILAVVVAMFLFLTTKEMKEAIGATKVLEKFNIFLNSSNMDGVVRAKPDSVKNAYDILDKALKKASDEKNIPVQGCYLEYGAIPSIEPGFNIQILDRANGFHIAARQGSQIVDPRNMVHVFPLQPCLINFRVGTALRDISQAVIHNDAEFQSFEGNLQRTPNLLYRTKDKLCLVITPDYGFDEDTFKPYCGEAKDDPCRAIHNEYLCHDLLACTWDRQISKCITCPSDFQCSSLTPNQCPTDGLQCGKTCVFAKDTCQECSSSIKCEDLPQAECRNNAKCGLNCNWKNNLIFSDYCESAS